MPLLVGMPENMWEFGIVGLLFGLCWGILKFAETIYKKKAGEDNTAILAELSNKLNAQASMLARLSTRANDTYRLIQDAVDNTRIVKEVHCGPKALDADGHLRWFFPPGLENKIDSLYMAYVQLVNQFKLMEDECRKCGKDFCIVAKLISAVKLNKGNKK